MILKTGMYTTKTKKKMLAGKSDKISIGIAHQVVGSGATKPLTC